MYVWRLTIDTSSVNFGDLNGINDSKSKHKQTLEQNIMKTDSRRENNHFRLVVGGCGADPGGSALIFVLMLTCYME